MPPGKRPVIKGEIVAEISQAPLPTVEIPSGATAITQDGPTGATPIESGPTGATAVEPTEPGLGDKITDRFWGTDVEDDPLELPRLATTITGAIIGASAGAKAGAAAGAFTGPAAPIAVPGLGIAGGLVGGGLGAFAGAIAPESFIEAGETFGLIEEGTREAIGLSPEELRTVAEGEALLDLATGGGLVVLRGAGRGTAKLFTGARRALAERAARVGIDMIPVQVGDRIIGRGFVSVFGRFPLLGGGAIRKQAIKAEEQIRKVVMGLAKRTGPLTDASELGAKIFDDATELVKGVNKIFKGKYDAIFAQADEAGVHIVPKEVLAKADEILAKLARETPAQLVGEGKPGPALAAVSEFIEEAVLPLRASIEGGTIFANQSLKQMDGLISKIDQQIGTLLPGQKKFAMALLNQLRQAAQRDVITNVRGVGADEIGRALKALDTEFSHTMSELFETATAKRFGSVTKRGLRAVGFDKATRTPVDQLARIVVNLNSPQAMDELARLISPDTLRRVASHTLDDAMQMAMKTDGFVGQLNIEAFAKRLGLDGANAARRRTIRQMLIKSGSEITINDLDDIVAAGRALAGFDIPNVSSFIARRGAIGGIQGVINGVVPGLALLGGSGAAAGAAAAYSGSNVLGAIMFVGGSHLFARIISNPLSARALHKVFLKEASVIIRRKAMLRVLQEGVAGMFFAGEISSEHFDQLHGIIDDIMDAFDKHYKSLGEEK